MDDTDLSSMQVNIADIEDMLTNNSQGRSLLDPSVESGGEAVNQFRIPGTFLPTDALRKYSQRILSESYRLMGHGNDTNILQNFLSRLDRHGSVLVPLNSLNHGFTFITRPRLNLSGGNLRQNPILTTLYSAEENSVPFMIRALMDTRLCNGQALFRGKNANYSGINEETMDFANRTAKSGLVDVLNPFFTPLCNGLKGISGFPDFSISTETTEGDFHSGDFTFVNGGDMNNRTQEFSLEFRDAQGSIILSCMYYWCLYMALQAKGVVMAYQDDIYEQRLNYTVSIYRFVTDETRRHILWWAKATGCYPKSVPVGALFNISQGETTLSSAMNFSVPFVANDVKVNDPGALLDFNLLMQSYCPNITTNQFADVSAGAEYNFMGLPYISATKTGLELKWRTSNYYKDMLVASDKTLDQVEQEVKTLQKTEMDEMLSQVSTGTTTTAAADSAAA